MGHEVYACDKSADSSAFPGAALVATDPDLLRFERGSAPVFAVVATHGEWDEEAVIAALAHAPDYLGVVASPKRFAALRAFVVESMPNVSLTAVKNPAGLDIGALSPEEIAVSILAEVVKESRARHRGEEPAGAAPKLRLAQAAAVPEARDPVCGMMVRIEQAPHRAAYRGNEFFFCCDGCRARFIAAPDRYLAAGAGT
jgi:xanthine dehydrogenase accessory factor